jgi:hypothetical protein
MNTQKSQEGRRPLPRTLPGEKSFSWKKHFRAVSAREKAKRQSSFGALGLVKTAADLRDLVAAKDAVMADLARQMHPPVAADILSDFALLQDRYAKARAFAMPMLDYVGQSVTPKFVEGLTSAKNEYDGILRALAQAYPAQHIVRGDLQDLTQRLGTAYHAPAAVPQPGKHALDTMYQATDTAAKYMPDPGKAAVAWITPGLVPKTADTPSYEEAKKKLGDFGTPLVVAAIGLGAVVLIVGMKK